MKTHLVEKVLAGDAQTAARLMRDIDDKKPGTSAHLRHLYPHAGHAHIIGLTGAPAVGKSTLMDCIIQHMRRKGKNVGVLAIDPTSPYSGGAILGDRIRMQHHANDSGVFIKSIATRGHMGGLSQSAFGITTVMEAMGKEVILIETVGVGQDEVDIIRLAHTTIVVVTPGMGDGIQAVKSGIMETADIFAINKADLEGAETTCDEIKMMLGMRPPKLTWVPPVVATVASRGQGIDKLLLQVKHHWNSLQTGGLEDYRRQKARTELLIHFRRLLLEGAFSAMAPDQTWQDMVKSVLDFEIDPLNAAAELVEKVLKK